MTDVRMAAERCCGNCRHWTEWPMKESIDEAVGQCNCPIPVAVTGVGETDVYPMFAYERTNCPCYQQRGKDGE